MPYATKGSKTHYGLYQSDVGKNYFLAPELMTSMTLSGRA